MASRCWTCLRERNVNYNWNEISRYQWSISSPGRRYLLIGFRCDACPSLRHGDCCYRSLQIEYPSEELANIVKTTLGVDPEVLLQSYSCLPTFFAIMWRAKRWWWITRQVATALFDKSGRQRGYVIVFTQGIELFEKHMGFVGGRSVVLPQRTESLVLRESFSKWLRSFSLILETDAT